MTQIKKTLSIAGIIALVTAPAMAEIASTQYVQNIVNNVIPTSGMVGDVLKKTADGVEWAAAPTVELKTTTGASETATMTQLAITDALNAKLNDNSVYGGKDGTTLKSFAIGPGANADEDNMAIGPDAYATGMSSLAIGWGATVPSEASGSIALGGATAETPGTFVVGLIDYTKELSGDYTLLTVDGTIPYERFAPLPPAGCKASVGQKCALVVTWDGSEYSQSWEVVKVSQ